MFDTLSGGETTLFTLFTTGGLLPMAQRSASSPRKQPHSSRLRATAAMSAKALDSAFL